VEQPLVAGDLTAVIEGGADRHCLGGDQRHADEDLAPNRIRQPVMGDAGLRVRRRGAQTAESGDPVSPSRVA